MDKNDISQLTEFPRFESESNQSGVTMFFNKLWRLPLFSPNEISDENPDEKAEDKYTQLEDPSKKEVDIKNYPGSQNNESGRNVMRKISVFTSGVCTGNRNF